jgi:hypothetical protein
MVYGIDCYDVMVCCNNKRIVTYPFCKTKLYRLTKLLFLDCKHFVEAALVAI